MQINRKEVMISPGGYASTSYYILINTDNKVAYYIEQYSIIIEHKDSYKLHRFRLTDKGIEKLKEYANLESDYVYTNLSAENYYYYIINYQEKETKLKAVSDYQLDLDKLFSRSTKKY